MKKTIGCLLALAVTVISFAQPFEGEIIYKNSYKSKMPALSDEQFLAMMGSQGEYYIKDGNYKIVANGSMFQWQLYTNETNKLYIKVANSETILWNDGLQNPDSVLKAETKKEVIEILGYLCDELVLTCRSGVHGCQGLRADRGRVYRGRCRGLLRPDGRRKHASDFGAA